MTSNNIFQQVFALNLASNIVGPCKGTTSSLQKKFQNALPPALQLAGSGWEVAWGPVVWKADPWNPFSHQGNAWYIAKNNSVVFEDGTTRCAYVIAIAGTSGIYDWMFEDFSIKTAIDLDTWAQAGMVSITTKPASVAQSAIPAGKSSISNGFGGALYELLNNASPAGCPGAGTTIPEFLKSLPTSGSGTAAPKLIVTGHSLGGALSPSLAYTLLKAQVLGPFSQADVLVYPTAGPSPGNQVFADNFSQCFPSTAGSLNGYQYWNVNIVNTLDLIPCAYCMTKSYEPLYFPDTLTRLGTPPKWAAIVISTLMEAAGTFYIPLKASFFTSKYPYPPAQPTPWLKLVHQQHVPAYTWEILGMDPPKGACQTSVEEDLSMRPLLATMVRVKWQIEGSRETLVNTSGEESANALLDALLGE